MKVLVTGASGFVGTFLTPHLAGAGHDVVALSRSSLSPQSGSVRSWATELGAVVPADLVGIDAVVHLAGVAHRRGEDDNLYFAINRDLTLDLFQKCETAKVKSFVFLSSAKVHGDGSHTGYQSSDPFAPGDAYSTSKAEAEQGLHQLATSTTVTSLRPPVIYGPNPKANIALLVKAARTHLPIPIPLTPNRRSFIGIANLCTAIETGANRQGLESRGYLVDDGMPVSTAEFFDLLAAFFDHRGLKLKLPRPIFGAIDAITQRLITRRLVEPLYTDFWIDDSKFGQDTGWTPSVTLTAGIENMLQQTSSTN